MQQETVGLQRKEKEVPAFGMAVATVTWRPQSQEEAASQRIVGGEVGLGSWKNRGIGLFVYDERKSYRVTVAVSFTVHPSLSDSHSHTLITDSQW